MSNTPVIPLKFKRRIGSGTFGEVFECINSKNESVAVKQVKVDYRSIGLPPATIREISILQDLRHPNIIRNLFVLEKIIFLIVLRLIDVYLNKSLIYLVFEYLHSDLRSFLLKKKKLTRELQNDIMRQLLKGLSYCHSHCILHRDLKPENILLTSNNILKIADFGLARALSVTQQCYSPEVASLWYRSLEILLSDGMYSASADVWSVGCIMAEILGSPPLFPGKKSMDQIFLIIQTLGTKNIKELHLPLYVSHLPEFPEPVDFIVKGINEIENDLIMSMLRYDSMVRITASEALNHKYFKNNENNY